MTDPATSLGDHVYARTLPNGMVLLFTRHHGTATNLIFLSPDTLAALDQWRDGLRSGPSTETNVTPIGEIQ